jgi:purine-nucleoside phosphorylase
VSSNTIESALETIRQARPKATPHVGLILGSGLGGLADLIEDACVIPYKSIPGFPLSHVAGHAGNLVIGHLGSTQVVAMQGRAHLYEGWTGEQSTFPLRCMHAMGVKALIVSNASGGINPRFHSGQVVVIDSHIDWINRTGVLVSEANASAARLSVPSRTLNPYAPNLIELAERLSLKLGFILPRGTYLATLGPNYETRAEYRMFAKLGADMVGMSTVPEVLVASQLGLPVLAFSIVTNVAKPDAPTITEHTEVLDWSRRAQSQLIPLIEKILSQID